MATSVPLLLEFFRAIVQGFAYWTNDMNTIKLVTEFWYVYLYHGKTIKKSQVLWGRGHNFVASLATSVYKQTNAWENGSIFGGCISKNYRIYDEGDHKSISRIGMQRFIQPRTFSSRFPQFRILQNTKDPLRNSFSKAQIVNTGYINSLPPLGINFLHFVRNQLTK